MPSDAIDIERHDQLLAYLRARGAVRGGENVAITTLGGGVSNRTVLVEWPDGRGWVLKQALAKLRVEVDWFSDPVRIRREAMGLRVLEEIAPRGTTTPLVFEDVDQNLLAMQAVPRPHENWKDMLLRGNLEDAHVEQFGALLAGIHRTSADRAEELRPLFEDRSFFESLRVEPYYAFSAKQVPEAARFLDELVDATRGRRLCLVHGDYSPKNVLVREGRIVLLDHEVIHWGDPAFDVAFGLTHLLSKGHHLAGRRPRLMRAAERFGAVYAGEVGPAIWSDDLERFCVRHALGCLLARVVGRSPMGYLNSDERSRQSRIVIAMMATPVKSIAELVRTFWNGLEAA